MKTTITTLAALMVALPYSYAAWSLTPLEDVELGATTGGDLGIVLDNYSLTTPPGTFIKLNASGFNLELSDFGIVGATGTGATFGGGNVTLGTGADPFTISIQSTAAVDPLGNSVTKPILGLAAPLALVNKVDAYSTLDMVIDQNGNGITDANEHNWSRLYLDNLDISGSKVNLFSNAVDGTIGFAANLKVKADYVRWSLNTPSDVNGRPDFPMQTGAGAYPCGMTSRPSGFVACGLDISLPLGAFHYQPLRFTSDTDGNYTMELQGIPNIATVYDTFYGSPAGSIRWSDSYFYTPDGTSFKSGGGQIDGIRIHHMKLITRGL